MKKKISFLSSLGLTAMASCLSGYVISCSKGGGVIFNKDSYKEFFKFDDSTLSDFRVNSASETGNSGYWAVSRDNEIKEFTLLKPGFVEVKYQDQTNLNDTARKPTGSISGFIYEEGSAVYNPTLDYKLTNSGSGDSHKRVDDVVVFPGSVKITVADDAIKPEWDKKTLDGLEIDLGADKDKLTAAGVGARFDLNSKMVIIEVTKSLKEPIKFNLKVKNKLNDRQVAVDEEINLSTKDKIISLNKRRGGGAGTKFNIVNNNFTYGKLNINYYEQNQQTKPTFSLSIDCKNQVKQSFFTSAQIYQWIASKKDSTSDDYLWNTNIVNTSDSLVSWNSNYGYVPSPKLQQKGLYIWLQLSMNVTGFKIYPTTLKPDPTLPAPGINDGYIDDKSTEDYSSVSKVVVTNSPTNLIPDKTWPKYDEYGSATDTKPFDKDHTVDGKADATIKAAKDYAKTKKWTYFSLFIGVPVDVTPDKKDADGSQVIFEFTADLPDDNPDKPVDPDKADPSGKSLKDNKKTVKSVYKLVTNIGIVPFVPPQD